MRAKKCNRQRSTELEARSVAWRQRRAFHENLPPELSERPREVNRDHTCCRSYAGSRRRIGLRNNGDHGAIVGKPRGGARRGGESRGGHRVRRRLQPDLRRSGPAGDAAGAAAAAAPRPAGPPPRDSLARRAGRRCSTTSTSSARPNTPCGRSRRRPASSSSTRSSTTRWTTKWSAG